MAIERIHAANLINFGILPLTFADRNDYDRLDRGDSIRIPALREAVMKDEITAQVTRKDGSKFDLVLKSSLSDEDRRIILAGGRLNLK